MQFVSVGVGKSIGACGGETSGVFANGIGVKGLARRAHDFAQNSHQSERDSDVPLAVVTDLAESDVEQPGE
jgi:hypothetical protein